MDTSNAIAYQVRVKSLLGLRLRAAPTVASATVEGLVNGAVLTVIGHQTLIADNYNWLYVQAADGKVGYVAAAYTERITPALGRKKIGLHYLQEGDMSGDAFIALLKRLDAAGHRVPVVTIVNAAGVANAAVPFVDVVVYRGEVGASDPSPMLPSDEAGAIQAGKQWVTTYRQCLDETVPGVYVQVKTNEWDFHPLDYAFWLGVMEQCDALGRKAAIFADSVGTPEPAQWVTRIPALQYAMAHGHVVELHEYGRPVNYPESDPTDAQYYGLRHRRLIAAVPVTARPRIVLSEVGRYNAVFPGIDAWLADAEAYDAEIQQDTDVVGGSEWTVNGTAGDGWAKSSINSALPNYESWMMSGSNTILPPAATASILDLSQWNEVDDLNQVKAAGVSGILHKASQSTGWTDPTYAARKAQAQAAGLLFGAYHFGVGETDPVQQADHFLAVAGNVSVLALDLETNPEAPLHGALSMTAAQAETFVQHIHAKTGRWPVLYTSPGIWNKIGLVGWFPGLWACWLWVAAWGNQPVTFGKWSTWTIWQHTDGRVGLGPYTCPGIKYGVDRSKFNGSVDELVKWWSGG